MEKIFFLSLKNEYDQDVYAGVLTAKTSRIDRCDQFGSVDTISMMTLFLDERELAGKEEEFWLKMINSKKIQEIAEQVINEEG